MRYTGGMAGGSWMTALAGDLGNGKFDGGYLVENFENQNPANTYWSKHYNLWSKVDTEGPRYIEFEKWWGGHVNLNAEEIQWIVDKLFVGNRLATAEIVTSAGDRIDLRNIRSPIVCFCSKGDNITPPQQALGWIVDLYQKDDDIRAGGQTIVYAIHDSVGHLGIFVSGGVARKEHDEFASNIDLIDVLPPGLYEAVMTPKAGAADNPDLVGGNWIVRFEPRTLAQLRAIVQPDPENERRFAAARRVSEINLGLYRTFLQPFVRAFASSPLARQLHALNPAELPYQLFSDANVDEAGRRTRGAGPPGPAAGGAGQPAAGDASAVLGGDGERAGSVREGEGQHLRATVPRHLQFAAAAGDARHARQRRSAATPSRYRARAAGLHPAAHRRDQGPRRRRRRA
jgi:hypothetical protein